MQPTVLGTAGTKLARLHIRLRVEYVGECYLNKIQVDCGEHATKVRTTDRFADRKAGAGEDGHAPGWTLSLTSLQKGMQVAKHWKSVYLSWWPGGSVRRSVLNSVARSHRCGGKRIRTTTNRFVRGGEHMQGTAATTDSLCEQWEITLDLPQYMCY